MRNLSFILSLTAAAALVTTGCGKKAPVAKPTSTASHVDQPAAAKTKKPATVGEASVTTDDTSGTAPPSGPIYFEFDSSTLTAESRDLLSTFAAWAIQKKPKLRIEGHTDERGTTEYNLALGDRRARAVASYLTDLGVDTALVDTITFGEERPAADGSTEADYSANRRGEVKSN